MHSRRHFLQQVSRALLVASVPVSALTLGAARACARERDLGALDPIQGLPPGTLGSTAFNGDNPDTPHSLFWDKPGALAGLGGIPPSSERVRVCIVGGGIAGLTVAHKLKDYSPVVFEGAPQLGGNAKGETWNGVTYSLGSAYVAMPDEKAPTRILLEELKLWSSFKPESASDATVAFGSKLMSDFWEGASDPPRASEFRKVHNALKEVAEKAFPPLSFDPAGPYTREAWEELDRMTLKRWFETTIGQLHPHVEEFLRIYCWSAFASEFDTISALQGLNFLCSDLGGILVLPGGNSAIARALASSVGASAFRAGTYAVDVAVTGDGVRVCYHTPEKKLRTLTADVCIVACPKWVGRFVVSGLSKAQDQAMNDIPYQAYLSANVLVRGRIKSPGYDLFRLEGKIPGKPQDEVKRRPWADFICAAWAAGDKPENSAVTLYRPLPYQGAQQFLFNPTAHDKHRDLVKSFLPELCGQLGIDPERVLGVRHTRWGHALPHALAGLLAREIPTTASAPFGERVFFAHQDNWASPCIESSIENAILAAKAARAIL